MRALVRLGLFMGILVLGACGDASAPKKESPAPSAPSATAPNTGAKPPPAGTPAAPGPNLDAPLGGGSGAPAVKPPKKRLAGPRRESAAPEAEPPRAAEAEGPALAGAPPGEVAEAPADWDLVPVYFGTDRGQVSHVERIDYGFARGRRLELGRALATVPRIHQTIERPRVVRIPYIDVTLYEEAEDPRRCRET